MGQTRSTSFSICDRSGLVIAIHERTDYSDGRKRMLWRLPDRDEWGLGGLASAMLPLYGTQWIDRVPIGGTVILGEGESAVEALWRWRVPALGTVTGASGTPGPEALGILLPYDVVTWEDHDEAGTNHMRRIASWLQANGNSPRRLLWGSEKGDDAADFVKRGGTRSQLAQMLENATPWPVEQLAPQRRPAPRSERLGAWEDRREQARHLLIEAVESAWGPPVRHMGRSVWWVCRLHAGDREPSFKCDLREDFFRCFGCGARGDIFTFKQLTENASFREVLLELVPPTIYGVPVVRCGG